MSIKNTPNSSNTLQTGAKSMAELLAAHKPHILSRGEEVEAIVLHKKGSRIILDLGSKSEGVVEGREYEAARDFIKTLRVGQKITATIVNPEAASGDVLVSLKQAGEENAWQRLAHVQETREPIIVTGKKLTRGGLNVDVMGIAGFIPVSQLSAKAAVDQAGLLERQFEALVIELDRIKTRIVLSERAVSERDKIEQQSKVLSSLIKGEIVAGEVVAVIPSGIFVRANKNDVEFDGFVHISEMAWKAIDDPSRLVQVGDKVNVVFLGSRDGKIKFSLKQAQIGVWEEIKAKYQQEVKVQGVVTKVTANNLVVEFDDGLTGFLATSKLPAGKTLKEGEAINCFIESIDDRYQRINLGLVLTAKPIGYK